MPCPHLIQAAKLDPYDPAVFLLIGHYQRLAKKDLRCMRWDCPRPLSLILTNTDQSLCIGGQPSATRKCLTLAPPTLRQPCCWAMCSLPLGMRQGGGGARRECVKWGLARRGCGSDSAVVLFEVCHGTTTFILSLVGRGFCGLSESHQGCSHHQARCDVM